MGGGEKDEVRGGSRREVFCRPHVNCLEIRKVKFLGRDEVAAAQSSVLVCPQLKFINFNSSSSDKTNRKCDMTKHRESSREKRLKNCVAEKKEQLSSLSQKRKEREKKAWMPSEWRKISSRNRHS
jgi:hypothetical protein